jgi:hypothetical protein
MTDHSLNCNTTTQHFKQQATQWQTTLCKPITQSYTLNSKLHTDRPQIALQYNKISQSPPATHWQTSLCTPIPHRYILKSKLHTERPLTTNQYNKATKYTASYTLTDHFLHSSTTKINNTPLATHW